MLEKSDWQNAKLYEGGTQAELVPQWVNEVAAQPGTHRP